MIAQLATVPPLSPPSPEAGSLVAGVAVRRPTVGSTTTVRRGLGHWLALARAGLSCRLPGPLADARIPARAPPSLNGIVVIAPAFGLDSMVLHVITAGRWELRRLRSIGQLGLMLDFFTIFVVRAVIGTGLFAPPLLRPRSPLRSASCTHRGPCGQGNGAVALRQATPPSVGLRLTPLARGTGPSPTD